MTGAPITCAGDAIWDDGEWVSWEYIESQLSDPLSPGDDAGESGNRMLFNHLLAVAREYYHTTGRHLQIFGELGELYAEVMFGLKRHRAGAPGSDGKIGNEFVEVKTIGPTKAKQTVSVKRSGNFSRLLVVRIDSDYSIQARIIKRSALKKGSTGRSTVSWNSMSNIDEGNPIG